MRYIILLGFMMSSNTVLAEDVYMEITISDTRRDAETNEYTLSEIKKNLSTLECRNATNTFVISPQETKSGLFGTMTKDGKPVSGDSIYYLTMDVAYNGSDGPYLSFTAILNASWRDRSKFGGEDGVGTSVICQGGNPD